MSDPAPELRARPQATLLFMGAVIFIVGGIVLATVGWYVRVTTFSGDAVGARVRVALAAACEAEARPALLARLSDYGIPAVAAEGFAYDLTLPGVLPDEAEHLPRALVAPGRLAVAVDGVARPAAVEHVGMQLAFSGTPVTLLMLRESLPDRGVTVTLDGVPLDVEEVTGPELQIAARAGQSAEAIRLASDRAVQIRHPLPCPVELLSVSPLGAGG